MTSPEYLKPAQAAALLNVNVQTIRRWVRAGKIEVVRLPSGTLRIPAKALNEMLTPDSD